MSRKKRKPKRNKQEIAQQPQAQMQSMTVKKEERFSGPLPPPAILASYDELCPGSAQTIIDQFVRQGDHRMQLETKVISNEILRANAGLAAGFLLAAGVLIGSGYFITLGYELGGAIGIVSALGSLVGVFIYGTHSRKDERIQKERMRR